MTNINSLVHDTLTNFEAFFVILLLYRSHVCNDKKGATVINLWLLRNY